MTAYKQVVKEQKKLDSMAEWLIEAGSGEVMFSETPESTYSRLVTNINFSKCYACNRISVWVHEKLVHPPKYDAPAANPDMPHDVAADYREAGLIAPHSPRGAAALLRLAIQRLMIHLGQKGENLNEDIRALVAAGMDIRIQQSLDVVRVVGNHSVHPGHISLNDDGKTVATLFKLVNLIVDATISQPKHIAEAFDNLPETARAQIEKRDA
jgi:hypothetical protein